MTDPIHAKIQELMNDDAPNNQLYVFESVHRVATLNSKTHMNTWELRVPRKHVTPTNWGLWMHEAAIQTLTVLEADFAVMRLKFEYAAILDPDGKGCWGFKVSLMKQQLTREQEVMSKKIIAEQKRQAVLPSNSRRDPMQTITTRLVDGLVRGKEFCTVDMCFDFDGVIHIHPDTTPNDVVAGVPVEGVFDIMKAYSKKYTIAVLSVRSAILEGREAMKKFIAKHAGADFASKLQYPDHKPIAHWYFDDRAIRIDGPATFPSEEELENKYHPTWYKRDGQQDTVAVVMAEEVIDEGLPEEEE